MPKVDGLTDREEKFLVAYAATNNGRQSALEAGYSPKIASVMACRILKKPIAIAILNKIRRKDEKKYELTREAILSELAKGLFRDPITMQDSEGFVTTDLKLIPPEIRTIINSFSVIQVGTTTKKCPHCGKAVRLGVQKIDVKFANKEKVQDMAMKHIGAYAPVKTENDNVQRIDWDSMLQRPVIIDPVDQATKQFPKAE